MIKVQIFKNFDDVTESLVKMKDTKLRGLLEQYGQIGVDRLKAATPVDTGLTRDSWNYEIFTNETGFSLRWYNTNMTKYNYTVVYLLVSGHYTKSGGWIPPNDFVSPIYDQIVAEILKKLERRMVDV